MPRTSRGATRVEENRRESTRGSGTAFLWAAAAVTIAASHSGDVYAQEVAPHTSVENRNRPEYSPRPLRLGGFDISPRVDAEVEYDDNIFLSSSDPVDSLIFSLTPTVAVRDQRSDRELYARLLAGVESYSTDTMDDRFRLRAESRARFGLGTLTRLNFRFQVNRNNSTNRRDQEFRDTAQPIKFTNLQGNAEIQRDFGPFTGEIEASYRSANYDGSIQIDGVEYGLGFRDFETLTGRTRLSYARSDNQRFYLEVSANDRSYSGVGTDPTLPPALLRDRSSKGMRVVAGYSRQVTGLLQLDLRAGYLTQDYDDPILSKVDGFSFTASALWNPTPLTSVDISASRDISQTVDPLLSGLLRTDFSVAVDHELLRNLILSVDGRYVETDPTGDQPASDEWELGAGARYFMSRNWSMNIRGVHFTRNYRQSASQNRMLVGLRYHF